MRSTNYGLDVNDVPNTAGELDDTYRGRMGWDLLGSEAASSLTIVVFVNRALVSVAGVIVDRVSGSNRRDLMVVMLLVGCASLRRA